MHAVKVEDSEKVEVRQNQCLSRVHIYHSVFPLVRDSGIHCQLLDYFPLIIFKQLRCGSFSYAWWDQS